MRRKLVAALACRNQGERLYGKPIQNLYVKEGIKIIDNIIDTLKRLNCIDSIVLGISHGEENLIYKEIAKKKKISHIIGDQKDVLHRLILCGNKAEATDIFRITSESPFLYHSAVKKIWDQHCFQGNDATFFENIIDGCGFEIIRLSALETSHLMGDEKHRSEFCTLYIRENPNQFKVKKIDGPLHLKRQDLRLTVDNPEDLVVCRKIYEKFKNQAPLINLEDIISFLDETPSLKALIHPFTEEGYKTMYL